MKYLALLTLVSAAAATHSLLATVGEDADIADRPDPKRDDTLSEKDANPYGPTSVTHAVQTAKHVAVRRMSRQSDYAVPNHQRNNVARGDQVLYNGRRGKVVDVANDSGNQMLTIRFPDEAATKIVLCKDVILDASPESAGHFAIIKKRQEDAKVLYKLGTEGGGNDISAKECYEAAVKLDPNFLYAWYYLGLLGGGNGMSEKECYLRAVKLGPNDPKNTWAWNKLGTVGGGNGKREEECYVMALRLNPSNADARNNLNRIRFRKACNQERESQKFMMMAQTLWYSQYSHEAMNPYVFSAPQHPQATMHFPSTGFVPTIPFQAGHMPFFSPQQMPIRESRRSKKSGADRLATHSSTRERSQSLRRSLSRERKEQIKNLEEFGNCCAFCARPNPDTTDHLLPLARGGDNSRWNLVPACRRCNEMKDDKDVWEWYRCDNFQVQSFFTEERAQKLRQFQESQKAEAEMSSSLPITRDSGHSMKKAEQRTVKFSQ